MSDIIDFHSHHLPYAPESIISVEPGNFFGLSERFPNQFWSVGIHPWNLTSSGVSDRDLERLEEIAMRDDVLAVGETGIDRSRLDSVPMYLQQTAFRKHIEISEMVRKPLIIHSVRAQDIIIKLRKELRPEQPWIIHGFRGKPGIARMYIAAGIYLGFGENFNPESLTCVPTDMILTETDESSLTPVQIINRLNLVTPRVTEDVIIHNIKQIFKPISK